MSEAIGDFARLSSETRNVEQSTISTVSYRLIPFLVVAYFFCVLDRVNVSFAALTMNADLGFSPLVYAWGAGIFFIGYFTWKFRATSRCIASAPAAGSPAS